MGASRYDTVLAALEAGVVIHAPDTAILEANDKARELLGLRDLHGRVAADPEWVFFEEDLSPMPLERFPVMQVIATGRPLRRMIAVVRRPDAPDRIVEVSALPLHDDDGTLAEVAVTFIDVTARETQRRDAEKLSRHLAHVAVTDELTGVNNRRGILGLVADAVAAADRDGTDLCVCMLDLDRFKQVNDRFGHARGDEVLAEIGARIAEALRQGDLLGRFGGEEFLLLLPDTDAPDAVTVAERVRRLIGLAGNEWSVTASIGVAWHLPGEAADDVIRRADRALYEAKEAGRDTVRLAP